MTNDVRVRLALGGRVASLPEEVELNRQRMAAAVPRDPLLNFKSGGSYGNATSPDGHLWYEPTGIYRGPFVANQRRVIQVAGKWGIQIEGAWAGRIDDLDTWALDGTAARAAGQADPRGGTAAFRLTGINTGSNSISSGLISGFTSDAVVSPSFFIRRISTTGVIYFSNDADISRGQWRVDLSLLPDGWERVGSDHAAVTVVAAFQATSSGTIDWKMNANSGGPLSFDVFWPQFGEGVFPGSPIEPAATPQTRLADEFSFSTPIPPALLSGKWSVTVIPNFGSADLASGERHYIFNQTGTALRIEESGGNVRINWSTASGAILNNITFSRRQSMTFTLDFGTGTITTDGATTGDGDASGSVTDWPDSTLAVGATTGGIDHFYGIVFEPELAA